MRKLIDIPDEILEAFETLCVKEKLKPKLMMEKVIENYTREYWMLKGYGITPFMVLKKPKSAVAKKKK